MSPKKKDKRPPLERELEKQYKVLETLDPSEDTYEQRLKMIERLEALRNNRKRAEDKRRVDPNTVIGIVGELVGMGFIMNFERLHVLSTKAFSRLWRPRI